MKYISNQIFLMGILVLLSGCSRTIIKGREFRDLKISNPYKNTVEIPFELIHNLVVIPAQINDSEVLHFILDTGVGRTIITELGTDKKFNVGSGRELELRGLGDSEPVPALSSLGNELYLKGIEGKNQEVIFLLEGVFFLSELMGKEVNGLIGYDVFKNFTVEINYSGKKLRFHDPDAFSERYDELKKSKKWTYIPVDITDKKLYVDIKVEQPDNSVLEGKFLIDSGASHNLFIYPSSNEVVLPSKTVYSYLGTGINGDIYGEIGRTSKIDFGGFTFINPVLSYPEREGIKRALQLGNRDGSLGAELLKRFTVIFNYADSSMLLKPNKWFKNDFKYNLSGIEIIAPISKLPIYQVSKLRKNSRAEEAGLREGDVIIEINRQRIYGYTLDQVLDIIQSKEGEIVLLVERNGDIKRINFRNIDETVNG